MFTKPLPIIRNFPPLFSNMPFRVALSALFCLVMIDIPVDAKGPVDANEHGAYWHNDDKCDTLFETPVPRLPSGSYLTTILGEGTVQAHYALENGGKIRLSVREVRKVPVVGADYAAALENLYENRPLQDSISRKVSGSVVLADVTTSYGLSFRAIQTPDKTAYMLKPDNFTLIMRSKVRAADWTGYDQASANSQRAWNRHQCVSYHHELGHILVALQLLEDSQTEWFNLRAPSAEVLKEKQTALYAVLVQKISKRQDLYHEALKDMGDALGESRPYLELPFDWLVQGK